MRYVRRTDLSPRVEMVPLIDVIFLLLTFFIYALVTMVQAQVLPVQLQPLTTGKPAQPQDIAAITLDARGRLYLDREPIASDALDTRLHQFAQQDNPPALFLAMEVSGDAAPAVDRGPLLIDLIERVRAAGLTDFTIVGTPAPGSAARGSTEAPG